MQKLRRKVFRLSQEYKTVDEISLSDEELVKVAVKFLVYDLLYENNEASYMWSKEIIDTIDKEQAALIKERY